MFVSKEGKTEIHYYRSLARLLLLENGKQKRQQDSWG